jgi:hypothetical protein
LDLKKIYVDQKSYDKIGLGFMEFSSPPTFNNMGSPKEKEEHT